MELVAVKNFSGSLQRKSSLINKLKVQKPGFTVLLHIKPFVVSLQYTATRWRPKMCCT